MSANEPDEAQQRLNYFNGQRLAAADFRAEQAHHVGMRRVINRALYSPGIVVGLEVVKAAPPSLDPADRHRVIVRHGLAFDNLGREIFLPVDVKVQVTGAPRSAPGVVFGNLLVVSYHEARQFPAHSQCTVGAPYQACGGDLAWGAPTRIVADAVFEFLDSWPADDSGKIVLSQVELDDKCNVVRTSPAVRRYAVPAKPQTVRPLSLEGEKDIDKQNSKVLHFHIDGGAPESAVLYLFGRRLSTLFYTELGKHQHDIKFSNLNIDITHNHTVDGPVLTATTGANVGIHGHAVYYDKDKDDHPMMFDIQEDGENWDIIDENDHNNPVVKSGAHQHEIADIKLKPHAAVLSVPVAVADFAPVGATDVNARNGAPALSMVPDLIVKFDGNSITRLICDQLEAQPGQGGKWRVVGNGGPNDIRLNGTALNTPDGSGEIDLLKLGLEIGIGPHRLEFVVAGDGSAKNFGGQVQYNLYVS
jgi:hypothetical protein